MSYLGDIVTNEFKIIFTHVTIFIVWLYTFVGLSSWLVPYLDKSAWYIELTIFVVLVPLMVVPIFLGHNLFKKLVENQNKELLDER